MQCISCGKNISAIAKVCPYCHRDTKESSNANASMFAFAIVGGILGYLFNGWLGAFIGGVVIGGIGGGIALVRAQSRFGSQAAKVEVVPDHESRRFSSTTSQEIEQAVRAEKAGSAIEAQPKPISPISPPSSVDHSIELLEKLVALRTNGTLTDEEFVAMKREILVSKPPAAQIRVQGISVSSVPDPDHDPDPDPDDQNIVRPILRPEIMPAPALEARGLEKFVRSSVQPEGPKKICQKCKHVAVVVSESQNAACPACGAIYAKVEQAIAAKAKAATSFSDTVPDPLLQETPVVIAGEIKKQKVKTTWKSWALATIAVVVVSGGFFAFEKRYKPAPTAGKNAVSMSSILKADKPSDIKRWTLAEDVLAVRGKPLATRQIVDNLVEWEYPDITYSISKFKIDGVEADRVLSMVYGKDYKHPTYYKKRNPTASQLQQETLCLEMKNKNPASDKEKCMNDAGYVFNEFDFRVCIHVEEDGSVCDKVAWIPRE